LYVLISDKEQHTDL